MGIPVDIMGCSDTSSLAQRFTLSHGAGAVMHLFDSNAAAIAGGRCLKHGRQCVPEQQQPHIATGGLPCEPFSNQRTKTAAGPRSGPPSTHPAFTVGDEFVSYLEQRRPHCFLVEEVTEWDSLAAKGAASYMQQVARRCAGIGYAVRAVTLDHGDWVDRCPRKRMHLGTL